MKSDITESSTFIPPTVYDIDLVGFLNSGLGLGETARAIHRSLVLAGFKVRTINCPLPDAASLGYETFLNSDDLGEDYLPAPVCICSLNGEHMPNLARQAGNGFFEGRKMIGVCFWETPSLSPAAGQGFPYLDEIWTCSEFTADAIRRAAPQGFPVKIFPHPVSCSSQTTALEAQLLITDLDFGDRFVFLFSMDFKSCVKRKNPHGVCEAFVTAFPEPLQGGPVCVIKSINADQCPVARLELQSAYAHRKDIIFFDGFLPTASRDALHARANCYVSLHRAEGLGLTLLESMAAGKPCIATAFSGNLSFMNESNSLLIPFRELEVGRGSLNYPADDQWADPDIGEAATAMRECFERSARTVALAAAGLAHISATHSFEAAAKALSALVQQSMAVPPRIKKLGGDDYLALARERLEHLKKLEADIDKKRKSRVIFGRPKELALLKKAVFEGRKGIEFTLKAARKDRQRDREHIKQLEDMIHVLRNDVNTLAAMQKRDRVSQISTVEPEV